MPSSVAAIRDRLANVVGVCMCVSLSLSLSLSRARALSLSRSLSRARARARSLSSDLDGTMLGNEQEIQSFFRVWDDEYRGNNSVLIYNTGRPLDSALGLIQRGNSL